MSKTTFFGFAAPFLFQLWRTVFNSGVALFLSDGALGVNWGSEEGSGHHIDGKVLPGASRAFLFPGLVVWPTPPLPLSDHTLSLQGQFVNLWWEPKMKLRQFLVSISCSVSSHFLLCFHFVWPGLATVFPGCSSAPFHGSSGGRKGKVKSGRSLVVCGHLGSAPPPPSLYLHNLLPSLRALIFLHFQPFRCLSFRVLLLDLSGEGGGACFSGEGGFLTFYVFKRWRLLLPCTVAQLRLLEKAAK